MESLKAVIAEDEQLTRTIIRARLEKLGHVVVAEAGDGVRLDVAKYRAQVQRAADGGRRRVERVYRLAITGPVKMVSARFFPAGTPL